ncbi:MAG: immunoglobulin domain-containing protein [Clostridia bacterium]|nr:immunoglobulin domain-containing protein [Clostridia bacterium]
MPKRAGIRLMIAILIVGLISGAALAEGGAIRTYLTFRVTNRTQSAIANVGEDLQIEVGVDGVEPTAWQWYFEGEKIENNADERIYNIVNAQMEDAGLYTMQAYQGDKMVLKVDVNVRVIDTTFIPASGDDSFPVYGAFIALGIASLMAVLAFRRRQSA